MHFDQWHQRYRASCRREIHYNVDARRSSSGSNTAIVVMAYHYKQDRMFIYYVLVYIFLERDRLISGKCIIFGLRMMYNRFFSLFCILHHFDQQPNRELVG